MAEPALHGALIEMRAVRVPRLLAAECPADQHQRGVGEVIQRQDQRRRPLAGRRRLDQQRAHDIAQRHAADIAQENAGRVPVPHQEADRRAGQRQPAERQAADGAQHHHRQRYQPNADRRRLHPGDAVDAVHEIVQVHEPQPAQRQPEADEPGRHAEARPQRREIEHGEAGGHRGGLDREPEPEPGAAQIVEPRYRRQRRHRRGEDRQLQQRPAARQMNRPQRRHHRGDHGDAAAARRGRRVRAAFVGPVEHLAPGEPAHQHAGARRAGEQRQQEGEDRGQPVPHAAGLTRTARERKRGAGAQAIASASTWTACSASASAWRVNGFCSNCAYGSSCTCSSSACSA